MIPAEIIMNNIKEIDKKKMQRFNMV